jgi:hypothetical protein
MPSRAGSVESAEFGSARFLARFAKKQWLTRRCGTVGDSRHVAQNCAVLQPKFSDRRKQCEATGILRTGGHGIVHGLP